MTTTVIVASILLALLACVASHAHQLEQERNTACDTVDEHLEAIQHHQASIHEQRVTIASLQRDLLDSDTYLRTAERACLHALNGQTDDALALITEFRSVS